MLLKYNKIEGC